MRRDEAIGILCQHREELSRRGVRSLRLFGSVARDEARAGSDVDVLVEFDRPVGFFALERLRQWLEGVLGTPVDIVTPGALRSPLRERILAEAVRAA